MNHKIQFKVNKELSSEFYTEEHIYKNLVFQMVNSLEIKDLKKFFKKMFSTGNRLKKSAFYLCLQRKDKKTFERRVETKKRLLKIRVSHKHLKNRTIIFFVSVFLICII